MFVTSPCEGMPWTTEPRFRGLFYVGPAWDEHLAPDLARHASAAWLLTELKCDREAAATLTPDTTAHRGTAYETSGSGGSLEALLDARDRACVPRAASRCPWTSRPMKGER